MPSPALNRTGPVRGFLLVHIDSAGLGVADVNRACRDISPSRVFDACSARIGGLITELGCRALVAESYPGP